MDPVIWSHQAVDDLEQIHGFIARDSVAHANEFLSRLIDTAEANASFPRSGKVVAHWGEEDVRQWLWGMYRILYCVRHERCYIIWYRARLPRHDRVA
jgi:toxin ParE1/3/4